MCANLAPVLESAKADGTSLVLTYAEDLDTSSVPLPGAYSVRVDGGAGPAVSSVSVSGTTVTLTLATAVTAGPAVTVTYTPGSNPVQDESGLDALPLTGQEVVIVDTTPPIPASAEVPASGDTPQSHLQREPRHRAGQAPPGRRLHRQGRRRPGDGAVRGRGHRGGQFHPGAVVHDQAGPDGHGGLRGARDQSHPGHRRQRRDGIHRLRGRQQLHRGGNPAGPGERRGAGRATGSPSPSTRTSTSGRASSPRPAPSPSRPTASR